MTRDVEAVLWVLSSSWWGWVFGLCAAIGAGTLLADGFYAVADRLPRLRLHLREAVSYRLHLLLILVLSRLLKLEVAREIRKVHRRRSR